MVRKRLKLLIFLLTLYTILGETYDVQLWTLGNFLIVFIEGRVGQFLTRTEKGQALCEWFSPRNRRRILGLMLAFWQILLYFVAFFFLSNVKASIKVFGRCFSDNFPYYGLLFFVVAYSNAQFRLELVPLRV